MVMDNICFLLNNFLRCSAYENIIFCWVMHEQSIIDEITKRLDTDLCLVKCISLTANEAELRARLAGDISKGLRDDGNIERSLARLPLYDRLNTIKIDTNGKSVQTVADEIMAL